MSRHSPECLENSLLMSSKFVNGCLRHDLSGESFMSPSKITCLLLIISLVVHTCCSLTNSPFGPAKHALTYYRHPADLATCKTNSSLNHSAHSDSNFMSFLGTIITAPCGLLSDQSNNGRELKITIYANCLTFIVVRDCTLRYI